MFRSCSYPWFMSCSVSSNHMRTWMASPFRIQWKMSSMAVKYTNRQSQSFTRHLTLTEINESSKEWFELQQVRSLEKVSIHEFHLFSADFYPQCSWEPDEPDASLALSQWEYASVCVRRITKLRAVSARQAIRFALLPCSWPWPNPSCVAAGSMCTSTFPVRRTVEKHESINALIISSNIMITP